MGIHSAVRRKKAGDALHRPLMYLNFVVSKSLVYRGLNRGLKALRGQWIMSLLTNDPLPGSFSATTELQ